MNLFGTKTQPSEDNPLYETWILYEMVKCLEETILKMASAQKSDRDREGYPVEVGGVKQKEVDEVIDCNRERMKELKGKLEPKLK
jgi:hypothetical protein